MFSFNKNLSILSECTYLSYSFSHKGPFILYLPIFKPRKNELLMIRDKIASINNSVMSCMNLWMKNLLHTLTPKAAGSALVCVRRDGGIMSGVSWDGTSTPFIFCCVRCSARPNCSGFSLPEPAMSHKLLSNKKNKDWLIYVYL